MSRSDARTPWPRSALIAILLASFATDAALAAPPRRAVKAIVRDARALADEKRWQEAAARYLDAHALIPDAVLLFNAARCFEMARELDAALGHFDALLAREDVEPELRAKAEERHRALSALIAARGAPSPAVSPGPIDARVEPPEPTVTLEDTARGPAWVAGWATLGSGLALVAVGGALLGVASARYDDGARAASYSRAQSLQEEGDALHAGGWTTLGLGLAASVAGSVVLIHDALSDDDAAFFAAPVPGGGVFGFASAF